MEQQELSLDGEHTNGMGSKFDSFLKKLNLVLPYDPAVMPLGIYLNELKTNV